MIPLKGPKLILIFTKAMRLKAQPLNPGFQTLSGSTNKTYNLKT
jgi:hypothetical protein